MINIKKPFYTFFFISILMATFIIPIIYNIPLIKNQTRSNTPTNVTKSTSDNNTIFITSPYIVDGDWFNIYLTSFGGQSLLYGQSAVVNGVETNWWTSGAYITDWVDLEPARNTDGTVMFSRRYYITFTVLGYTSVDRSFLNVRQQDISTWLIRGRTLTFAGTNVPTTGNWETHGSPINLTNYVLFDGEDFYSSADKHAEGALGINIVVTNQWTQTPSFDTASGTWTYTGNSFVNMRSVIAGNWDSSKDGGLIPSPGLQINAPTGASLTISGSTAIFQAGTNPTSATDLSAVPPASSFQTSQYAVQSVIYTGKWDGIVYNQYSGNPFGIEQKGATYMAQSAGPLTMYYDPNTVVPQSHIYRKTDRVSYFVFPRFDLSPEVSQYKLMHKLQRWEYEENRGYVTQPNTLLAGLGLVLFPPVAIAYAFGAYPTQNVDKEGPAGTVSADTLIETVVGYRTQNVWIKQNFTATVDVYADYDFNPSQTGQSSLDIPNEGGTGDVFNPTVTGGINVTVVRYYWEWLDPANNPLLWIMIVIVVVIVGIVVVYALKKIYGPKEVKVDKPKTD